MSKNLTRFTGRAAFYARYRPGYPDSIISILRKRAGWRAEAVVADIGAGTGISSEFFLRHGNTVWGVEPNADMRAEAEQLRALYPNFQMIEGAAEETGLLDGAFDFVVAATALHWFDAEACRTEFRRILRPGGKVVLLWNLLRSPETPFLQAFEQMSLRYKKEGRHRWGRERHTITKGAAKLFGGSANFAARYLDNTEPLDFEGLKGRLMSSSNVPLPPDERFEPMIAELRALFDRFAVNGLVEIAYQTALFWGELPAEDNPFLLE